LTRSCRPTGVVDVVSTVDLDGKLNHPLTQLNRTRASRRVTGRDDRDEDADSEQKYELGLRRTPS
jgi:hypothetical protein